MLLARVADHLFWGARYLERAQATARVVRTFTEVIVDLPTAVTSSWEPLLAVAGSREQFDAGHARANETDIIRFLVADPANPGSVVASVAAARENLRTTREILPGEAWHTVNDLFLYTASNGEAGVDRRSRNRFLSRVIAECQRYEGVLTSGMSRDEAYEMWRLGQSIERADMTTRMLGIRAAALLALPTGGDDHDEVQCMGVLRSLAAMQMYQRATRGPIAASSVVDFLLSDTKFPRSVSACVQRIRRSLNGLPHDADTLPEVEALESLLAELRVEVSTATSQGGAALDTAMDRVQVRLAELSRRVTAVLMRGGG